MPQQIISSVSSFLNGLTLTNTKGAAINNQSKKRTFIITEGANTLSDGSGTLTVNAVGKAGITGDDYVRFMTGSVWLKDSAS